MLYDQCDENLRTAFCEKNNINDVVLYTNGVGQYDTENKLIREFVCKYDCSKLVPIGEKSLTKAMNQNITYNSHYYKFIGSKLYI